MDPDATASVGRVPHGSSDAVYDFSANCNPRVPDVRSVYDAAFETARSYPNETSPDYRAAAAEYVDCAPEQVIPTAGGMAALRLAIEVTVNPRDSVLIPVPSFGEYAREVQLQGATPTFVPYNELLAVDPSEHALAIICTPNNPTGDLPDRDRLLAFAATCRDAGTPLLVDEAFLDFTDQSSLAGTRGVVVARSLTKMFGLPGLRAGFAVASGELRERLRTAVPPWELGSPAAAVGTHCLRATEFVNETRERVQSERKRMRRALASRFEVADSRAPFLLIDVGTDPKPLIASLRSRDIAVRDATTFRGLDTHIRVAVRLPDENDRLVEVLLDA
ncbi:threonine-phosphate decarboxylase CobD [Halocatena marina]|uniref:threonine-phosphate decarboxylase CobD n=1 Tax=Halocatena marina TaxID=2934937 RepID=UPI0022254CFF|nr:threonine-phosphate decarboxylase CobD [Halocatena marina]